MRINYLLISITLSVVITNGGEIPIGIINKPFWDNPCGVIGEIYETDDIEFLRDEQIRSITKILEQLKPLQSQLEHRDIASIVTNVQKDLERKYYGPNWIPDIDSVLPVIVSGIESLSIYTDQLVNFHTDLQKFAIAFEQILFDQINQDGRATISSLKGYLRSLLCEVEMTMLLLGQPIPDVLPRSLMTPTERTGQDYTIRIVRDNGILLKYKEFIDGWVRVFEQAKSKLYLEK